MPEKIKEWEMKKEYYETYMREIEKGLTEAIPEIRGYSNVPELPAKLIKNLAHNVFLEFCIEEETRVPDEIVARAFKENEMQEIPQIMYERYEESFIPHEAAELAVARFVQETRFEGFGEDAANFALTNRGRAFFQDLILEACSEGNIPYLPVTPDWNARYRVNLILMTKADTAVDRDLVNNFVTALEYGDGDVRPEVGGSIISWLCATQGLTLAGTLFDAARERRARKAGIEPPRRRESFPDSFVKEIENDSGHYPTVAVAATMTLDQIQRLSEGEPIGLPPTVLCGLFDEERGAGSTMEIQLARSFTITKDLVHSLQIEGVRDQKAYGYTLDETYGLTGHCWDATPLPPDATPAFINPGSLDYDLKLLKEAISSPEFEHPKAREGNQPA